MDFARDELRRLYARRRAGGDAAALGRITSRLLRRAGIGRGMSVLDVDCGAGEVARLAAGLVGPCGRVVGIDPRPDAVAEARERAREAGLRNVEFLAGDLDGFEAGIRFDAVVGRFVLIGRPRPVARLQSAARNLAPGGIVAFHESGAGPRSLPTPPLPAWRGGGAIGPAVADAGDRLIECFSEAGLPRPHVVRERPVEGGSASVWLAWAAAAYAPEFARLACLGADAYVDGGPGLLVGPTQLCAWTRV